MLWYQRRNILIQKQKPPTRKTKKVTLKRLKSSQEVLAVKADHHLSHQTGSTTNICSSQPTMQETRPVKLWANSSVSGLRILSHSQKLHLHGLCKYSFIFIL